MKKIKVSLLICLMLGSLSGCKSAEQVKTDAFLNLGYSEEETSSIMALSESDQEVFNEYKPELVSLLSDPDFREEKLNTYEKYLDYLDDFQKSDFFRLCNDSYFDRYDPSKIEKLMADKYFMYKNLNIYMTYYSSYDSVRDLVEYVNVKGYKESYVDYEVSDLSKDTLMIASKIYTLGDYVPEDLVEVPSDYTLQGNNYLRQEAYDAYIEMAEAARSEDIYFEISTSYRSYDFQTVLYNQYLEKDPQSVVDTYSSRPGFSDHQTGLTADIRKSGKTFDEVKGTPEMEWLAENSYKYGFIMRYPEGKEAITRYEYEWWHFRYVGKEAAEIIHDDGITFDEYYEYYVNND